LAEWHSNIEPPKVILPKGVAGLNTVHPREMARQITIKEYQLFAAIKSYEFVGQGWMSKEKEERSPNLLKFIGWFNALGAWVANSIVTEELLPKRKDRMKFFVDLGQELFELQNFNAVFAVMQGGLRSAPVFRLKKTMELLNKKEKSTARLYQSLHEFVSSDGKFKVYRGHLKKTETPLIPYLGIFLTDLTMIHDTNKDLIEDKVNFQKCTVVADIILEIKAYQRKPFNLKRLEPVANYVDQIPHLGADENTLFDVSVKNEAKTDGPG